MDSLNSVSLIGRLGAKPRRATTRSGTAVTTFSIATNAAWYDEKKQLQQRTEWHSIVAWGKTAEIAGEHLDVGRLVFVDGELRTREYIDKQGVTRFVTEVHVNPGVRSLLFLDRPSRPGASPADDSQVPPPEHRPASGDDDIPF